jgi:hypothetical protein
VRKEVTMRTSFLAVAAGAFVGVFASAVFAGDVPEKAAGLDVKGSWETFSKQFDLDRDGKVSWTEYQQVVSGFASVDGNHDGTIDKDEFDKAPHAGLLAIPGLAGLDGVLSLGEGKTEVARLTMPFVGGDDGADGGVVLGGSCFGGEGKCVAADPATFGPWIALGMIGKAADSNHDDVLTRGEWEAFASTLETDASGAYTAKALGAHLVEGVPAAVLPLLTPFFDRDKDGKVTRADLDAIFAAADTNHDGSVDKRDAPPIELGVEAEDDK